MTKSDLYASTTGLTEYQSNKRIIELLEQYCQLPSKGNKSLPYRVYSIGQQLGIGSMLHLPTVSAQLDCVINHLFPENTPPHELTDLCNKYGIVPNTTLEQAIHGLSQFFGVKLGNKLSQQQQVQVLKSIDTLWEE